MNIEDVPFVIQLLSTMQMSMDVPWLASLTVISYATCKSQQMCKGPSNLNACVYKYTCTSRADVPVASVTREHNFLSARPVIQCNVCHFVTIGKLA